ncbi:MAG TPA: Ada metal-binding domain-containing protein [Methanothrix sp.]|nr:Ada metal-binding domain-containing protein [Methanothrix sp.]
MSIKLPSLKRAFIASLVVGALLASYVYLAGEEPEISAQIGGGLSSALEDFGSLAERVRPALSWIGEPSSEYLHPPYETGEPSQFEDEGSDQVPEHSFDQNWYQSSEYSLSDSAPSSSTSSIPLLRALEINSSVSSSLFRTWGVLTIEGGSTLPYVILNATLRAGDRPIEGARYLMMDLEPGSSRDFDIQKVCRIAPGANYSCLLEVEGLDGIFLPQEIDCLIAEGDPEFTIWDGIEFSEELDDTSDELVSDFESSLQEPERGARASDEYGYDGYKYVGSKTSNKYHLPDCSYAKKIKEENRITFSDQEEAREAGYSPCGVCKPP